MELTEDEIRLDQAVRIPIISSAVACRSRGDLDEAINLLATEGDLDNDEVKLIYLKLLFEAERCADFQRAVRGTIDALSGPADGRSAEFLAFLLRGAERACLELEAIGKVLEFATPGRGTGAWLKTVWAAVRHRQIFRQAYQERYVGKVTLISLGLHCLPWALLNRWGLRQPSEFASLFTPFALAGHRIGGLVATLANDFADYRSDIQSIDTMNGHTMAIRSDRGAFWNHNRGKFWLKEECSQLKKSLEWKIENFRHGCKAENAVFVLSNCPVLYPQEPLDFLADLKAALRLHTGRRDNYIILANQQSEAEKFSQHRVDRTTFFLYCPYPEKRYVWHDKETADSHAGLIYERVFVMSVARCLLHWKLLLRRDA